MTGRPVNWVAVLLSRNLVPTQARPSAIAA
jgi:hypothetical protein